MNQHGHTATIAVVVTSLRGMLVQISNAIRENGGCAKRAEATISTMELKRRSRVPTHPESLEIRCHEIPTHLLFS